MILGLWLLAILGVVTGFLSGLLGIGGNLLAIPMTLFILKATMGFSANNAMHFAIGSCVTVMVFTSSSSLFAHYRHQNINWQIFKSMIIYVCTGTICGAILASYLEGCILEKVFAVFLLVISIYMFMSKIKRKRVLISKEIPLWIRVSFGFLIGFKSGLLGIGGGTMIIPLLLFFNHPHKQVVGTTSAFSFTLALTAAIIYLVKGLGNNIHVPYSVGFIYLPIIVIMVPIAMLTAQLGAKVSHKMSSKLFAILLNGIMFLLGLTMLLN